MALSRRRKILLATLGAGVCGIAAYFVLFEWVSVQMVVAHQRSTTRELAEWEREYSQLSTAKEAERAAEMLQYAQQYYVVGGGYRSDPETEAKLEAQRCRTIDAISNAIEKFKRQEATEEPTR